jgi:hypothetical protein
VSGGFSLVLTSIRKKSSVLSTTNTSADSATNIPENYTIAHAMKNTLGAKFL